MTIIKSRRPSVDRRSRAFRRLGLLAATLVGTLAIAQQPAKDETPIGPKWWPSEWGDDDQRGAANRNPIAVK